MILRKLADAAYLLTSFAGAIIVAANVGYAQLGYSIFLASSILALYLLSVSNASRSLMVVAVLFMAVNIFGIIRG